MKYIIHKTRCFNSALLHIENCIYLCSLTADTHECYLMTDLRTLHPTIKPIKIAYKLFFDNLSNSAMVHISLKHY